MWSNVNRLERLATWYSYSTAAVRRLISLYGVERGEAILKSLKKPGSRYFLRVNTLKASPREVVEILRGEGLEAYTFELLPDAVYMRVAGPFEVKLHRRVVVADKAAAESVYMGADLYAPGVLNARGVREGDRVSVVSPKGHLVAEGIAVMDGEEMVVRRRGLAVKVVKSVYRVPSVRRLIIYDRGLVYDQSLPAMVASHVLAPKPGWLVVDMCAAPGGKATHVAQLMGDEGRVVAIDRSEAKCDRLRENVERLGLRSIEVRTADSRFLDVLMDDLRGVDAVILDPPCSALGVRPSLYYERSDFAFESLSRYQRQFMKVAARLLRPGGLLLYSTCTLSLEENEVNVKWATRKLGFKLRAQKLFLGSRGFLSLGSLVQRFEPDVHDTPGFFIALLEKK